jgi:DNA helicase HerA-like ATPase
VPVAFSAKGFERHTAIFAQSGSGKSYSLGVLLEELIVNTTARLVIIDPNGDFTALRSFKTDSQWTPTQQAFHTHEMQRLMTFEPSALAEAELRMDDLLADHYRGAIFNLNGVEVLLWQKIVWVVLKRLWRARNKRVPTIIVVDESHHFAPANLAQDDDSPLKELGRIAAEGRKYGLWLVLATQRPQKLDGNVISQCDNLIVMRLTSRADTEYIAQAYNGVTREMVELAYGFKQGEALVVGRLVKSPTMLRFRRRNTCEGGADLPADWAAPRDKPL